VRRQSYGFLTDGGSLSNNGGAGSPLNSRWRWLSVWSANVGATRPVPRRLYPQGEADFRLAPSSARGGPEKALVRYGGEDGPGGPTRQRRDLVSRTSGPRVIVERGLEREVRPAGRMGNREWAASLGLGPARGSSPLFSTYIFLFAKQILSNMHFICKTLFLIKQFLTYYGI
jgi:hypothetical protein